MKIRPLLYGLISLLACGCDSSFNPNGQYAEQMVVYAIFTTESDVQYVRVYTTYPATGDPFSHSTDTNVQDAQVTVTKGNTVFTFSDTTVERTDTSRYRSRINVHVKYGMRLEGGQQYQITVTSPSLGVATGRASALYTGSITKTPDPNGTLIRIYPGQNVRAAVVRLFLEYEVMRDSTWQTHKIEIPRAVNPATGAFIYPGPRSVDESSVLFTPDGGNQIRTRLRQQFLPGTLRLKRTTYVLTQIDDALYAYYSTANGFPDSGTLRLDEPDYSNLEGALGLFGMTSQTVIVADTLGR